MKQMTVEQMQDYRENFGDVPNSRMAYANEYERGKFLKKHGFNADANDDIFSDTKYVYCVSHIRPHTVGWCTVGAANQYPLVAQDDVSALQETRNLNFPIMGDKD